MEIEEAEYLIIYAHRQTKAQRVTTGDWLGIHYLSSFLNENGIATLSFAGYAHEVPALLERAFAGGRLRVCGFSCDYENQRLVSTLCRLVKESRPEIMVVVGGPQAFALNEEFLKSSRADVIVCGEGELTSLEVCHAFIDGEPTLADVRGIKYLSEGRIVVTPKRDLIRNLDALPFPNEAFVLGDLFRRRMASFLTGRGCPYACAFCYEGGNTHGVRWRSVDNVICEIEQVLSSRPDIHYLMFTDDTFTVSEERVRQFCEKLRALRERYDFSWFCEGHVRTLFGKKELLGEMVDAGMVCLQIGIESGCEEILHAYGKGVTPEMIESVVSDAFAVGLRELWGNIILGGAHESHANIDRNIAFAKRLYSIAPGMVNMDVVYYWPLPGTKITGSPAAYGMAIVDPESVTSRMDLPVVEYADLSRGDFINERHRFLVELTDCAKMLIPNVPIERAVDILVNVGITRNRTVWYELISGVESFRVFFYLLHEGATELSCNIDPLTLDRYHPMRTGHVESVEGDGCLLQDGVKLSGEESRVLLAASGKLTVLELYDFLKDCPLDKPGYLKILRDLEGKRLLAFSRY